MALQSLLRRNKIPVSVDELKIGDILHFERNKGLYSHCAIYVGDCKVIHFNVNPKESLWYNIVGYLKGDTVIRSDLLTDVERGSPVYVLKRQIQYDARENIVKLAKERLGEMTYSLHNHNCHHFCQEVTGIEKIPSDKRPSKWTLVQMDDSESCSEVILKVANTRYDTKNICHDTTSNRCASGSPDENLDKSSLNMCTSSVPENLFCMSKCTIQSDKGPTKLTRGQLDDQESCQEDKLKIAFAKCDTENTFMSSKPTLKRTYIKIPIAEVMSKYLDDACIEAGLREKDQLPSLSQIDSNEIPSDKRPSKWTHVQMDDSEFCREVILKVENTGDDTENICHDTTSNKCASGSPDENLDKSSLNMFTSSVPEDLFCMSKCTIQSDKGPTKLTCGQLDDPHHFIISSFEGNFKGLPLKLGKDKTSSSFACRSKIQSDKGPTKLTCGQLDDPHHFIISSFEGNFKGLPLKLGKDKTSSSFACRSKFDINDDPWMLKGSKYDSYLRNPMPAYGTNWSNSCNEEVNKTGNSFSYTSTYKPCPDTSIAYPCHTEVQTNVQPCPDTNFAHTCQTEVQTSVQLNNTSEAYENVGDQVRSTQQSCLYPSTAETNSSVALHVDSPWIKNLLILIGLIFLLILFWIPVYYFFKKIFCRSERYQV